MANFKYVTKGKDGKTNKGIAEAPSKEEAIRSLRAKEQVIISLEEEKAAVFSAGASRPRKKKIKIDDLIIFTRQLATMVDAGIPLVIVSTEGSERDRDKGLRLGADAYLVKPFDPEMLRQVVADLLAGRAGAG